MTNDFSRRDLLALTAALTVTSTAAQACLDAEGNPSPGRRGAVGNEPADKSGAVSQINELIGRPLRIIRPNQPVTMDYSDNRVNIEVDDSGKILRITFG